MEGGEDAVCDGFEALSGRMAPMELGMLENGARMELHLDAECGS